jgi:Fic family protein
MPFNPNKPYNDLTLLPPKSDIETKAILKKSLSAAKALSQLNGATNALPNPSILINSIILQEAKASSEIENIITTNDQLYKALSSKFNGSTPETKEVLRYREAVWEGHSLLKKRGLTTNLFVRLYQIIKETKTGIRNTPGTKLINNKKEIIYTPPEGEDNLRSLLSNLEKFIHEDQSGIDSLIKSAVIHYQFESIHPFTDGNGRTGRIIIILYLILSGYLDLPILYLSRFIIKNKNQYYKLLKNVTVNNNWESWILYILDGIEQTSLYTLKMVKEIDSSLKKTVEKIRLSQKSPVPKEVIDLIYEEPYCKTEFIINRNIAARKAAERYLKELQRLNIIRPIKVGKEVLYINDSLFNILSGK